MSDPNQPREQVLERRMVAIMLLLESIKSRVACTCDFTEQGQHHGCPHNIVAKAYAIARKSVEPQDIRHRSGEE